MVVRRAVVSASCDDGHLQRRVHAATIVTRLRAVNASVRVSGRDLLTRRIGERANYKVSIVIMPFAVTVPRGPGCQSVLRSTSADGAKRSVVRHSDKARAAAGSVAQAPRRCRERDGSRVRPARSRRVPRRRRRRFVNGVRVIDYSNNPPPL